MKKKIPHSIQKKLEKRKEEGAYRDLLVPAGIDFFSNDYLGAARLEFFSNRAEGSTGSRSLSGNSEYTLELEKELAQFFLQEAALLYNSGYVANLGLISALAQRNEVIIYDALCHASIRDGMQMGLAKNYAFRHNDMDHLRERLESFGDGAYVVVESLYSMDGDQAKLIETAQLCKEYGAHLIVDEAHAGGVYGEGGRGLVSQYGLDEQVFAKVLTYGKAYGSHGAVVLGPKELMEYLVNYSRPFIFTTALSPHAQDRMSYVTNRLSQMDEERDNLFKNIHHFREKTKAANVRVNDSESAIQLLMVNGVNDCQELAADIREKGFMVKAIMSPTVPPGQERIRICLHSFNTFEEIESLIEAIR